MTPSRVLVGYDGSPVARVAVAHALARAGEGGHVLAAYVVAPPSMEWIDEAMAARHLERERSHGRAALDELAAGTDDGRLATKLVEGPAAETLVELADAEDLEEIVVGSRGFGAVRAMLGSVSHALLHEADRPVVVIPARMLGADRPRRRGCVVVGYDGSPTGKDAVAHAAHRLDGEGRLVVVYAFEAPKGSWPNPIALQASADSRAVGERHLAELAEALPGGRPFETELVEGPPAAALVQVANRHRADEIVVGSRGLGRFRAALGSVSHALVHEAEQPVVIVPQSPVAEEEAHERRSPRRIRVPGITRP